MKFIAQCHADIAGMKNKTVLNSNGDFYSEKSVRTIEQNTNRIAEFFETLGGDQPMSAINFDLTESYRIYLLEKGHAKNTVSQYLSVFRFWIRRFHKFQLLEFSGSGIRCGFEMTTQVFNSIDELKLLNALDLPPGKRRVLDVYICQCFLGLRVADMMQFVKKFHLYRKQIGGKSFFEIKTSKTGEIVVIPAAAMVEKILKKYNYDFGKSFSEQYYSRELRAIVKDSEIDRKILFYRTEGGEKIERIINFSDKIGTHTARRSFATNAYLSGIPPLDIMKITGHKTFTSFFKYIRCENTEVALRIHDHDFFRTEL